MQHDDMLTQLRDWHDDAVPAGLAERIMRNARATPQYQPWWKKLADSFGGTWDSAWELKGPAFAAVLILGLVSGQLSTTITADSAPHFSWTEGL